MSMKLLVRLVALASLVLVVCVAVIKYVQGCSWKEAVGILEEFVKEMRSSCCVCNAFKGEEDDSAGEA